MAGMERLPLMQSKGQIPYMPTGYEGMAEKARQKRAMAEALLQAGLAGPGAGARSYAQLLASLAQSWAGKSLQKDAVKLEGEVRDQQMQALAVANQSFEADAKGGMTPQEMAIKWGSNPLVRERLKDIDTSMVNVNGVFINPKNQKPGSFAPSNPNDQVVRGPDGNWQVNPARVDASIRALGLPVDAATMGQNGSYPDPTKSSPPDPLTSAPGFAKLSPVDQEFARENFPKEAPEAKQRIIQALSQNIPQGLPVPGQAPVGAPTPQQLELQPRFEVTPQNQPQIKTLTDGSQAYFVNGKWYDNPEGK